MAGVFVSVTVAVTDKRHLVVVMEVSVGDRHVVGSVGYVAKTVVVASSNIQQ